MQSYTEIWNTIFEEMKKELPSASVNVFFNDLELRLLSDTTAVFVSAKEWKCSLLIENYMSIIKKYFCDILNKQIEIVILSDEKQPVDLTPYLSEGEAVPVQQTEPETEPEPDYYTVSNDEGPKPYRPNKEYTFDNFLVGNSNKFAHAASLAVAKNAHSATKDYNPLFIYGSSGLGKTHLLYAITNYVLARDPDTKIVYVKGEEFTNQMIASISNHTTAQFRENFRSVNMLLIDDIQFIAGREATQEEFFHTFNALYEEGKQIIMTSDRPPREIKRLEDRLRTRFEWGMIADIQPPNFELRTAIMRKKAELLGFNISDEILRFLAENLTDNVRQLEGALKRIMAHSMLDQTSVTVSKAREWVSDMISATPKTEVTVDRIMAIIAQKYSVSVDDLKSRKKSADIVNARHKCVYLIRTLTDLSTPQIGRIFSRDHSTIINSIKNVEFEIENDAMFEREINELIEEIKHP